ncbi:aminodeoxychorismate lyase [Pantoea sp. A4]|uniref:aminodeoxychorismate lyase n=1 Tax=Pantoea sp. A4 TaxID=1225184 RepID=UPI000362E4CA|nr:aminodeoxychorismate lyase [Pantoea sp. A4]
MWINGLPADTINASDRAIQFGDGCFTTAAITGGKIQLLEAHLQRLKQGCLCLKLAEPDWMQLESEMRQAARGQQKAVLKVILTAGSGGRGYSRQGCGPTTRIISVAAWPQHYQQLAVDGVQLSISPIPLARSPLFAGIKHLNRLEQVLIRSHLDEESADDTLVLDTEGQVVECCAANLFWREGQQIFTPDVEQAGVNGVMRRFIMAQLASAGDVCHIVRCGPERLLMADEIVICNALMPVLPVRQLQHVHYHDRSLFHRLLGVCEQLEAE